MRRDAGCLLALGFVLGCHESIYFDRADARTGDMALDAGSPVGCGTDEDCPLATLHCDPIRATCVPCIEDIDCMDPALPRCDVALGRCIQCGRIEDCPSGRTCEMRTKRCIQTCTSSFDCAVGHAECELETGICQECEEAEHCRSTPATPVCEPRSHVCVACTSDAHCGAAAPRCDPITARCVQCTADSQCPVELPVCDPVALSCVLPGA